MKAKAAFVAGVALLSAACTASPAPSPAPPAASKAPYADRLIDEPPSLRPIKLADKPAWSWGNKNTTGGSPPAFTAQLRGDTAILSKNAVHTADDGRPTMAVADAATGAIRWSYPEFGTLRGGDGAVWWPSDSGPIAVGDGDDLKVIVEYIKSRCPGFCPIGRGDRTDEFGVAALSGRDGSVLWQAKITGGLPAESPEADQERDLQSTLRGADTKIAMVNVAPSTSGRGESRVIALDVGSGKRMWELPGTNVTWFDGHTVVGIRPPEPGNRDGTAFTIDPATGQQRLDLTSRYPHIDFKFSQTSGDTVVVPLGSPQDHLPAGVLVLDTATGAELDRVGALRPEECAADDQGLLACGVFDDHATPRIATIQPSDHKIRVSKALPDLGTVDSVWHGHIFLATGGSQLIYADADRSGNVLNDKLPGRPTAISDKYAIFTVNGGLDVYRL